MAGPVSAGPRPTARLTVGASEPVPAATSAKVVIVKAGTQAYLYEDYALIHVSPFTRSGEVEFVSGIGVIPGQRYTVLYGNIGFPSAVPNTEYTFRYRNEVLDTSTNTYRYSPWVQFTVRSPQL